MAPKRSFSQLVSSLSSTPSEEDQAKRMQEILAEEASNATNMRAASEAMKNLKPDDINRMLEEMENMNPFQKKALSALGMNPEMMKKTMEMMRDNPKMVESAQKLMENMVSAIARLPKFEARIRMTSFWVLYRPLRNSWSKVGPHRRKWLI